MLIRLALLNTETELFLWICWGKQNPRQRMVCLWDSSSAYTGAGRWGL
jgi:hypothetical protein